MKSVYFNYEYNIAYDEWQQALSSIGMLERVCLARTIVIKPNLCAGSISDPDSHIVTDVALLRSAIQFLCGVNISAVIYIAESDSTGNGFAYKKFEHLQLPQVLGLDPLNIERVKLLDLSRDRLSEVKVEAPKYFKSPFKPLFISETLLQADVIMNLSNLKTHSVTRYSGACKNLFGCLPALEKSFYHTHIHQVIHDLVIALAPCINVVDGFFGMEGNGPCLGEKKCSGYRIISSDPIIADINAANSVGMSKKGIKYIRLLEKTLRLDIKPESEIKDQYEPPKKFLLVMNAIGLSIQCFGQTLASCGHKLHGCTSIIDVCVMIARPIMLRFFKIEDLRRMRKRVEGSKGDK